MANFPELENMLTNLLINIKRGLIQFTRNCYAAVNLQ